MTATGTADREPSGDGPTASKVEAVLAGLSDPTRRRLLDLLSRRGETTATEAAAELPVSRQAVAKHLAVLERAGLVKGERRGREVRYVVRPPALEDVASWLRTLASAWDRRLEAIRWIAESDREDGDA